MASPQSSSKITIPPSPNTVTVSVINSTSWVDNVPHWFCIDPLYPGWEFSGGPSYSFYITHEPSKSQLLFDLGVRKNFRTHLPPKLLAAMEQIGMRIRVEKDVAEILSEHGVDPTQIDSVIYSHHHFDHVGDPTLFPGTTRLVVGPGYKKRYLPGYPANPESMDTTEDLYEGRGTVELEFEANDPQVSTIGRFKAYDYFADGSFYLLSTPGHTVGHLSALARTTASDGGNESTFIFLGGDIVHSCAVFRPTEKYPLPDEITPAPNGTPFTTTSSCPGELFAAIHRSRHDEDGEHKSRTTPLCLVAGPEEDLVESQRNADELTNFDGEDNIFTIWAHDDSLLDVLDFFPATANDWKRKGWETQGHWRFLAPLMKKEKESSRL